MSEQNILILCHYFPPVPGVGGRRWAKFVKYLSRKEGVNVQVVSAKNTVKDVESSFAEELKSVNFQHHTLPSNYPHYLEFLEFAKPSFWRKIMFRYQLFFLKRKVEGNYWDFSIFWKKHFEKTIPDLIGKNNITTVIVSGPPFRYTSYTVGLKEKFPQLKIILDYRDPWNDFNDPYPISADRHAFEQKLEKEILRKVDLTITVSEFQKKLILENEPNCAPVKVIPNGFDTEDYQSNIRSKEPSDKIKLTHFGTLHYLKDYYWMPFFSAYARLKKEEPDFYERLEIHLIGYTPKQVSDFIEEKEVDVQIHGILPPFEAYGELNQADIGLWFKYDGSPGDFATKFGDFISLKKYIWTFSKVGAVTDHIETHKIGKVFYRSDEELEETIFQSFLKLKDSNAYAFSPAYDPSDLEIDRLTDRLLDLID